VDSAQTQLTQYSLTGKELGAKSDHETEHGETTIPGFSKSDKPETSGGFRHCCSLVTKLDETVTDLEAEVALGRGRVYGFLQASPGLITTAEQWAFPQPSALIPSFT
jgi:hypothetical protein